MNRNIINKDYFHFSINIRSSIKSDQSESRICAITIVTHYVIAYSDHCQAHGIGRDSTMPRMQQRCDRNSRRRRLFLRHPAPSDLLPVSPPAPTASSSSVLSLTTTSPLPTSTETSSPGPWNRKRQQNAKAATMLLRSTDAPRGDPDFDYRSEEEPNDSSSDDQFSLQEVFDDWMVSLRHDQRQVILMENIRNRSNMNVKQAATEAGSVVGFNEKTVHRYRDDFFANEGHFSIQLQGKYERHCVHTTKP